MKNETRKAIHKLNNRDAFTLLAIIQILLSRWQRHCDGVDKFFYLFAGA